MSEFNDEIFTDFFNVMCGEKIGEGCHRSVFECKIRPDLVIKIEEDDYRYFANVLEMKFWNDYGFDKSVSKWLAPCEYMSPNGRVLLQKKCDPIPSKMKMPEKLPDFLNDIKRSNFGILNRKIVCVDYAITCNNISTTMRKVRDWD